jgi:hypothetical protein
MGTNTEIAFSHCHVEPSQGEAFLPHSSLLGLPRAHNYQSGSLRLRARADQFEAVFVQALEELSD